MEYLGGKTHHRGKYFFLILTGLFLCFLVLSGRVDAHADTSYLDYSGSAASYRRAVAEMNAEISADTATKAFRRGKSGPGATVLCRTEGNTLTPELLESVSGIPEQLLAGPDGRYTLRFATTDAAEKAVSWLEMQEWVCYAEFDHVISGAELGFRSWGAESMGMDGYLHFAGGWGEGSSMVAVIDSGVWTHEALAGRLVNGGYDYVDGDHDTSNDEFDHGTHVAGIIADCTQDASVMIYPIRVLDAEGNGLISNVVNAISEACDAGADVINLSMAVRGKYAALEDMIRQAVAQGITVVVSAGNFGCDTSKVCPANMEDAGVIVVSAAERSGNTDIHAEYSCYGSSVDVCAYGTDILSCSPDGGYSAASGTSMAAPHISAVCALMRLLEPSYSPADMEVRLKEASSASEGLSLKLPPLVPAEEGFRMWHIRLAAGETLQLPLRALPETCQETITWTVSGESLRLTENGLLEAVSPGEGELTAVCRGFADCIVQVTVLEETGSVIHVPKGVTTIEAEAFSGSGVTRVELPETVQTVGDGAFADCPGLRMVYIGSREISLSRNLFERGNNILLLCHKDRGLLERIAETGMQYSIYDSLQ